MGIRFSEGSSEIPFCGVLWRGNSLRGTSFIKGTQGKRSFRIGRVRGDLRRKVCYLTHHENGTRHRPRVGLEKQPARQLAAQVNLQLEIGIPAALSSEPISIFTPTQEKEFLQACDDWQFPLFLTLMPTGLRSGELAHLLPPDDLDLDAGWLYVRNKPHLGWRVKTRNERDLPLVDVLRVVKDGSIRSKQPGGFRTWMLIPV